MNKLSMLLPVILITGITNLTAQSSKYDLRLHPEQFSQRSIDFNGGTLKIRVLENVVYVSKPADSNYELLNIYVPEAYFNGGSINGYSASDAPIFFPNHVGGYMPAKPATTSSVASGPPGEERPSTVLMALARGYVVASAGARGRTTKDAGGKYTGKAPAAVVDLKAAVRFLKYNDEQIPGSANKIISNGTSAGGAMSALLGATGNNSDYQPYLDELGAAPATDDIFAVSAYCPITNLDHADAAYEWQFNGINEFRRMSFPPTGSQMPGQQKTDTLTQSEIFVSNELKKEFPAYLNSVGLKDADGKMLKLDDNGDGNFKELIKKYLLASAQKPLDSGKDLSILSWLTVQNGKATNINFDGYIHYLERQKTPPAFDALNLSTPENQEFGTETRDRQHFTSFGLNHSTMNGGIAGSSIVKMMNPMNYIGTDHTSTSVYWRIRHGSKDKDTGLAIPVMLATLLQNKGYKVDFALPWDRPHSGDYDLPDLFNWIDAVCK